MLGAVAGLASREGVEVVGMEAAGVSYPGFEQRPRRLCWVSLSGAMVVAIDGPAGAGKSTVARALARALGFTYLDSGAMYRAVGLCAARRRRGVRAARAGEIELGERVLLDGEDVTEAIRTPEVSRGRLEGRHQPGGARRAGRQAARAARTTGDWVAEGRDIGTVVAPDAALKVFLTASPEQRARRRAAELGADVETVLRDQALRDAQDSEPRALAAGGRARARSSSTPPA